MWLAVEARNGDRRRVNHPDFAAEIEMRGGFHHPRLRRFYLVFDND